jgi:predicted metal-binding membrane protein
MDSGSPFLMRSTIRSIVRLSVFILAFAVVASSSYSALGQAATSPTAQPSGEMHMEHHAAPPASTPVKITVGDKSESWTAATLAALPHSSITVYNEHAKATQTYSGVPLIALLARLGVADKPRGKDFRLYLVAEGIDGYQVVYSIGEISPDVHDGTTLIADSQDGKPITEDGPLKLVTTGEKRPARWVRNLVAIRVMPAQ